MTLMVIVVAWCEVVCPATEQGTQRRGSLAAVLELLRPRRRCCTAAGDSACRSFPSHSGRGVKQITSAAVCSVACHRADPLIFRGRSTCGFLAPLYRRFLFV